MNTVINNIDRQLNIDIEIGDLFVSDHNNYYVLVFYPSYGYILVNICTGGYYRQFSSTKEEAVVGLKLVGKNLEIIINK